MTTISSGLVPRTTLPGPNRFPNNNIGNASSYGRSRNTGGTAISASTHAMKSQRVSALTDSGKLLLLDLKRGCSQHSPSSSSCKSGIGRNNVAPILPTYNNKLVSSCLRDMQGLIQELNLQVQMSKINSSKNADLFNDNDADRSSDKPSMTDRPSILLHDAAARRQKRCLLAYHHHRMEIIKEIQRTKMAVSSSSALLPTSGLSANNGTADVTDSGSISTNVHEVEFAQNYRSLREQYSDRVFQLDMLPPTSHMVQVRVLENLGQVVLPNSGRSVSMTKGSCLYVERNDVTDFLRQGLVQLYDGEESESY